MSSSSLRGGAPALVILILLSTPALGQEELPMIDIGAEPARAAASAAAPRPNLLERLRAATADTAKLLEETPGVSLYEAGGVSRLPSIHGLADDRIRIIIGGSESSSACANHMNPPLSYVDPNTVGKIDVQAGVTSVAKGGDSIGGSIIVEPRAPVFAPAGKAVAGQSDGARAWPIVEGWPLHGNGERLGPDKQLYVAGHISSFFRSVNNGVGVSGSANVATEHFSVLYNGAWQRGTDYHAGNDGAKVLSTGFITENHAATIAYQNDGHQLSLRAGLQNIPYQAFVNQRMDMTMNRAYQFEAKYSGAFDWGKADFSAYYQYTAHQMGMLYDKQPDNMPMATIGKDFGYKLGFEAKPDADNTLRFGSEFHGFRLDDYWEAIPDICAMTRCLGSKWPYAGYGGGLMKVNDYTTLDSGGKRTIAMGMLMMGPDTQWNINGGSRDRLSHYAEWTSRWTPQLSTELGLRNDIVMMDVGRASPYDTRDPAPMPMLMSGSGFSFGKDRWTLMEMSNPDAAAANAFNARDRSRIDVNFDMTARLRYEPDAFASYEIGYARKTRSPNLYERYAWAVGSMSTAMVNWFGDGNGYTGNLDLKPEVAHTVGFVGSWRSPTGDWDARFAPYFSYVENYIDADRYAAFRFSGTSDPGFYTFQQLQFRNHKAILYGFDISGRYDLLDHSDFGRFTATALVNYTYGRDLDIGDVRACTGFSSQSSPSVEAIAADQSCYRLAALQKKGDALYNIMPLNARLGIEHRLGGWSSRLELQLVDRKTHVSVQRNELPTPAYALLNLRTSYEWENMRFDLGIENLTDALYYPALGGFYFTGYKAWTNTGAAPFGAAGPVPGPGRNFIAGLTVKF